MLLLAALAVSLGVTFAVATVVVAATGVTVVGATSVVVAAAEAADPAMSWPAERQRPRDSAAVPEPTTVRRRAWR
ncbi:hypothetical protein Acsp01_22580 [Actinoplanes sp. NBRC 101535]|nr:hypothetical protein Acsp01_22580 [Actinoplanes sp. NBRC 101535]